MPNPTGNRRDFLASLTASFAAAACGLPRPAAARTVWQRAPEGDAVASVAVFPPIGISRVGSGDDWFLAPEVPDLAPDPPGGFKDGDENDRIKRQVQRFRVYAFNAAGQVIAEVSDSATWRVRVANTKAAWYGFNNPLDLGPDAPGIPAQKRNASLVSKADREAWLVIDSGEQTAARGQSVPLKGTFWKGAVDVVLGELQVDAQGRLLVHPATGVSGSAIPDNPIVDFTKNDAWFDDWCDGWVKASVEIDGQTFEAAPGWVACCGPNFAPDVPPLTSLYDTIWDNLVRKHKDDGLVQRPSLPLSFARDIYPIFYRLGIMKWVSGAALSREGWIDVGDFSDPAYIRDLAVKYDEAQRRAVFEKFRTTHKDGEDPPPTEALQYRLPYMVGSGVDFGPGPQFWFVVNELQTWILEQWVAGDYTRDFKDILQAPEVTDVDELPLEERLDALTRAALEPCSGGNFHPGVELTWVLGRPELFDDDWPFRLAVGDRASLVQDVGKLITPENALPEGCDPAPPEDMPIGPQMPGDLTRWMGLPWQPDAFSCQNVLYANDFPTLVWWPALLPVDVLTEATWCMINDTGLPKEQRIALASTRSAWARGAAGIGYHANASYFDGLNRMVYLWERMGFVVRKPAPRDLRRELPPFLFVEVDRGSMDLEFNEQPNLGLSCPPE